jgi:hypothetical protein
MSEVLDFLGVAMSRRPARAVEVRCSPTGEPVQFLRGRRLYVVRAILAHWREATRWWSNTQSGSGLEVERTAIDRDVWRVEASMGRSALPGVFELARFSRPAPADGTDSTADGAPDYWVLVRVYD